MDGSNLCAVPKSPDHPIPTRDWLPIWLPIRLIFTRYSRADHIENTPYDAIRCHTITLVTHLSYIIHQILGARSQTAYERVERRSPLRTRPSPQLLRWKIRRSPSMSHPILQPRFPLPLAGLPQTQGNKSATAIRARRAALRLLPRSRLGMQVHRQTECPAQTLSAPCAPFVSRGARHEPCASPFLYQSSGSGPEAIHAPPTGHRPVTLLVNPYDVIEETGACSFAPGLSNAIATCRRQRFSF